MRLCDIRMKPKLTALFLLTGLLPLALIGSWSALSAKNALMNEAFAKLSNIRAIKKAQIEKFFDARREDMGVLMETAGTLRSNAIASLDSTQKLKKNQLKQCLQSLRADMGQLAGDRRLKDAFADYYEGFHAEGAQNSASYREAAEKNDDYLVKWAESRGVGDILLISSEGDILATSKRGKESGTNLKNGPYKDTNLAEGFNKAGTQSWFADMRFYEPDGEPAAFFIQRFEKNKEKHGRFGAGESIGFIAIQIQRDKLNAITLQRLGLGLTGETYLVGQDKLMRSDSYRDKKGHSVVASFKSGKPMDTEAVSAALEGKIGTKVITDYNGNSVLASWDSIELGNGVRWAMISQIDVAEAFCPKDENDAYFFEKYARHYGYPDLFLMTTDGFVLYSVARKKDYMTNMLTGEFKDSNLGILTKKVLETKKFGFADFAPYAPNNGEPSAFIAQPVVSGEDVELVVALQLSLDSINGIMHQQEGMGDTGEAYLVGPDKRMRSDSFRDKTEHSVMASFAGTVEKNGVDTAASRAALEGEGVTDTRIVTDYTNKPVLSAFAPIRVYESNWALISKIDQAEVERPVRRIISVITGMAAGLAVLIAGLALFVARQISVPLEKGVTFAKRVSDRDLTSRLDIARKDEVGMLADALNAMADDLTSIVEEITGGVNTVSISSAEMAAISQRMADSSELTAGKAASVAAAAGQMTSNMSSVAASMEQTAASMSTVAGSSDQMRDSISDIAANAARAKENTADAVKVAQKASSQVNELGRAAEEIGAVTVAIKSISDKTNLLALNATIEAARAGEAGKGFAVVANEIKTLAQQTADATDDISRKLKSIQKSTGVTVREISEVSNAIATVDDLVASIATAVEEQSATTSNMVENITQAGAGVQEINANVNQASTASSQVAKEIDDVNAASNELRNSSFQVRQTAIALSSLSEQLKSMVGQFRA